VDRSAGPPLAKAVPHGIALAGESAESKRTRIAEDVKRLGADAAVITLPDSICWLLNIRGGDVPHTPFALSFAILNADGSTDLFMDARKSSPELVQHLGNAVRLHEPKDSSARARCAQGQDRACRSVDGCGGDVRSPAAGAKVKRGSDPCQLPKACKNPVEIEGMRKAHIRDGAALTRFLAWVAREAPKGHLTEIEAAEALEGYRRADGLAVRSQFRFDFGRGTPRGHSALPRVALEQSQDQPRTKSS
jgi:Xaa-Pro aminopeptidase